MRTHWIVTWRFNTFVHAKRFKELAKAMELYYSLEDNGYSPTVHEE